MTEYESALKAIRDLDTLDMDKRKALALVKTIARAALRTALGGSCHVPDNNPAGTGE